jgi:hypothetical protein
MTSSEEELDESHISARRVTMMNWKGEAKLLLIKYVHISL